MNLRLEIAKRLAPFKVTTNNIPIELPTPKIVSLPLKSR